MSAVRILRGSRWEILEGATVRERSPGEYEVVLPFTGPIKNGFYNDKRLCIDGKPSTSVIQGNTRRSSSVGRSTQGVMILHVLVDQERSCAD